MKVTRGMKNSLLGYIGAPIPICRLFKKKKNRGQIFVVVVVFVFVVPASVGFSCYWIPFTIYWVRENRQFTISDPQVYDGDVWSSGLWWWGLFHRPMIERSVPQVYDAEVCSTGLWWWYLFHRSMIERYVPQVYDAEISSTGLWCWGLFNRFMMQRSVQQVYDAEVYSTGRWCRGLFHGSLMVRFVPQVYDGEVALVFWRWAIQEMLWCLALVTDTRDGRVNTVSISPRIFLSLSQAITPNSPNSFT